jgi:hypothetical protein
VLAGRRSRAVGSGARVESVETDALVRSHLSDPATKDALGRMIGAQSPAVDNLQRPLAEGGPFETA